MLQIHFMQQWFGLSNPAMEEALYDVPLYREFAGLDGGMARLPDETTIFDFGIFSKRMESLPKCLHWSMRFWLIRG